MNKRDKKYSIGIDFGTLSARTILVNTENGEVTAEALFEYPHGVMSESLPDGTRLSEGSAYQHPRDYLDALRVTIPEVLDKGKASSADVVGIGVDFTSCTMLPIDDTGTPLCFYEEFRSEPHAYVKLWKHHGAQAEADRMTEVAKENQEKWLDYYGGRVSSEWLFPKILETLNKAPTVYDRASKFIEAGDWLTFILTGEYVSSSCMMGYKGMWNERDGFPSKGFFSKLSKKFENVSSEKIINNILPTGTKAGVINQRGSEICSLSEGTAVAVSIIDAHSSLLSSGICSSGSLMIILGTSSCHIVMSEEEKRVLGICGVVKDGIIPGLFAYEAGQTAVGDIFDWFINNNLPYDYVSKAKEENKSAFDYVTEKAERLEVNENGLIALDWWNGCRTPYADFDLKGAIFGYTLKTKPEEIYRALIEATAFGTKYIVDLYENSGIEIKEIYATGGISQKNEFLVQTYADVLGKRIIVPRLKEAGAKGGAIFGAFAGGAYDSVETAVEHMASFEKREYAPRLENTEKYASLYKKYLELSRLFGKDKSHLIK